MFRDDFGPRFFEINDVVLFEWYDYVAKTTAEIMLFVVAERIGDHGEGDNFACQVLYIKVKSGPVSAGEQRVAPHRINVRKVWNRTFDDPAPAPRKLPRSAELFVRARVSSVHIACYPLLSEHLLRLVSLHAIRHLYLKKTPVALDERNEAHTTGRTRLTQART